MPNTIPIWLAEPASYEKQRKLTKTLKGKKVELEFNLKDIKSQLKSIRRYSVDNMSSLLKKFKNTISNFQEAKVIEAEDAKKASRFISKVAEDHRNIAVNKSSTVNELRHDLERESLHIIDTYYEQYILQEREGKINHYWQLPDMFPENIWSSFSFNKYDYSVQKKLSDEWNVGVIGVNAASAQDGAIFLLQHSQNVSKILDGASKIVFVIGIEKIVKDAHDASFQTKCDGLFGVESVMLGLSAFAGVKGGPSKESSNKLNSEPIIASQRTEGGKDVYMILLDNYRKEVLKSEFRELLYCIGCGGCMKMCPRYELSRKEQPHSPYMWYPKEVLFSTFITSGRSAVECGLYDCTLCGNCKLICPLEIPLNDFMLKMREICEKRNMVPDIHQGLYERIKKFNNPYRTA